jgi:lipooligosaccharide transport system ATP-binding protein
MAKLIGRDKALVEFRGVSKQNSTDADLRDVTFVFSQGSSYGLLGGSHSGVFNAIRMMYCSAVPEKGEIEILGLDTRKMSIKIKSLIGVVPRFDALEPDLSVYDQLMTFGRFYELSRPALRNRIRDLVQQLELADCEGSLIRTLRPFQKKKVAIARALLHSPRFLILDEICNGLNFTERKWIFDQLLGLKKAGFDLVVGSSDSAEIETLCDNALMFHRGQVISDGHPKNLIDKLIGSHVVDFECANGEVEYYFNKLNNDYEVYVAGTRLRVFMKTNQDIRALQNQISSDHMLTRRPNLEDVYFKTTGHLLETPWHNLSL